MNTYYIVNEDDELYHHGIEGMKWGVRRFQNEDGSLTDAGRKRYNRNGRMITKMSAKNYKKYVENELSKSSDKKQTIINERNNLYNQKRDLKEANALATKLGLTGLVTAGAASIFVTSNPAIMTASLAALPVSGVVNLGKNFINRSMFNKKMSELRKLDKDMDELKHHGILGQHWGVRRFQNEDGSLTEAGRKRYGSGGRMITDMSTGNNNPYINDDGTFTKEGKKRYTNDSKGKRAFEFEDAYNKFALINTLDYDEYKPIWKTAVMKQFLETEGVKRAYEERNSAYNRTDNDLEIYRAGDKFNNDIKSQVKEFLGGNEFLTVDRKNGRNRFMKDVFLEVIEAGDWRDLHKYYNDKAWEWWH